MSDLEHLQLGPKVVGDFTPKEKQVVLALVSLAKKKLPREFRWLHIKPGRVISARLRESLWLDSETWQKIFNEGFNQSLCNALDHYIWLTCKIKTKSQLRHFNEIVTLIY